MAEKTFNTRIQLKYDSVANWSTNNTLLKAGEAAIAYTPVEEGSTVAAKIMIKFGPGNFNDLPWASAIADDVHGWAKQSQDEFITNFLGLQMTDGTTIQSKLDAVFVTGNELTTALEEFQKSIPTELGVMSVNAAEGTAITVDNTDAANPVVGLKISETQGDDVSVTQSADGLKVEVVTYAALKEDVATNGEAILAINDSDSGILATAKKYVDDEDVFDVDMTTINGLGGIGAGADLNGLKTHDILKKLLYPYVDASVGNATASPNGGTYEKGVTKTITQVSISITKKSEPITSVALYNGSTLIEEKTGDAVKNGGTITFSGLSVEVPTNGNQLTVKVTYPDANGNAKTVSKTTTALTFVYPYYIGTCAAGTAIDETLVESLTKKVEGKGNKSNSFTVSDGHMVFAYPKAHGALKSILDPNNFETIGNYTINEVSVTGLDGTAQTYYVYVSGATTVSGFTVNFKY